MMGDVPLKKLIISPAFYAVQIDDCGPFQAYSKHDLRSALKVNALVITCINNSAVTIWVPCLKPSCAIHIGTVIQL